jgi:DNA repair protein RecO
VVPIIEDDALILDHHRFRDRDLVVSMLCRRHGVQRGVLRRARGGRVPVAASTQVLSRVHATLVHKPTAELATIQSIELEVSSFPIAKELERSAAGAAVAELLVTFCPPAEPMERAYRLGCAALEALLTGVEPNTVVAYVQFWLLLLSGLFPPASALEDELSSEEAAFLERCRRLPLRDISTGVPPGVERWLDRSVRGEAERPMRALSFLRENG